jgi:hypothetical protein
MDNPYLTLANALAKRKVATYFQSEDQLVVSLQSDPAWPDAGNSFWLSHQNDRWYLCTWMPFCYLVPAAADLVELCVEFVRRGDTAQAVVPDDLIRKYGLTQVDEAALFEPESE